MVIIMTAALIIINVIGNTPAPYWPLTTCKRSIAEMSYLSLAFRKRREMPEVLCGSTAKCCFPLEGPSWNFLIRKVSGLRFTHHTAIHQHSEGELNLVTCLSKVVMIFFKEMQWVPQNWVHSFWAPYVHLHWGEEGSEVENTWKRTIRNYTNKLY